MDATHYPEPRRTHAISMRVSKETREAIRIAARIDRRSETNWCRYIVERELEARKARQLGEKT
jgi:uncharacterized protein (DUF1778 family)